MIASILLSAGLAYFLSLPFASVLQGGGYRLKALLRAKKQLIACAAYFLPATAAETVVLLTLSPFLVAIWTFAFYFTTASFVFLTHRKMRINMHYTRRLVRLLVLSTALYVVALIWLYFASASGVWATAPSSAPLLVVLSAVILGPIEKANNHRYVKRAKLALSRANATKIGVTGSYGKTSVKKYLEQVLSAEFCTLASPENFNTPLGVVKTLTEATGREQMLVLEMGARRRGDIAELCDIVRPDVGVITGIAPQHLETFGTMEAVLAEKNLLAEWVPEEGLVVYNLTDPLVRKLYEKRRGKKVGVGYENADYVISEQNFTSCGSTFTLAKGNERMRIETPCVGTACAIDISVAAAVAVELGVSWKKVASAAKRCYPPSHRFEVVKSGDVTVIDDGYNANPVGAAAALESLRYFEGERKIVYTSGIVELGKEEEVQNRALGQKISSVASVAVVCKGRYGDEVVEGLEESTTVFRVENTKEASALFAKMLKKGDVLLIMSDLPRDYLL